MIDLGKKYTLDHAFGKKATFNAHTIGKKLTTLGTYAGYAAPIAGFINPAVGVGLEGLSIGSHVLGNAAHKLANAAN